jgi:hypothetical protein
VEFVKFVDLIKSKLPAAQERIVKQLNIDYFVSTTQNSSTFTEGPNTCAHLPPLRVVLLFPFLQARNIGFEEYTQKLTEGIGKAKSTLVFNSFTATQQVGQILFKYKLKSMWRAYVICVGTAKNGTI